MVWKRQKVVNIFIHFPKVIQPSNDQNEIVFTDWLQFAYDCFLQTEQSATSRTVHRCHLV